MLVMSAINDIRNRGGKIIKMTSLCGGIPDPIAANNPFRYKMSWSPRGMIAAICDNSAVYLKDNKIIKIAADKLLLSAVACASVIPTMRLEVLPNRDSLLYRNLYDVEDVESIFRGTLRYEGWGDVMSSLKAIGLFDKSNSTCSTWKELLLERALLFDTLNSNEEACYSYDGDLKDTIERILTQSDTVYNIPVAMDALAWLGFTDDKIAESMEIKVNCPPIDTLASLLETKLCYENNDRDMVAMSHSITGIFPNGDIEKHNSKLLVFGNSEDTAMALTVGYTAAAAAEFLLNSQLSKKFQGYYYYHYYLFVIILILYLFCRCINSY
jgi:alpha-aminoadipic semialdehyde synthase